MCDTNLNCPVCNYDLEPHFEDGTFEYYMMDYLECPSCKAILDMCSDEKYDGEEEIRWFWLEIIENNI